MNFNKVLLCGRLTRDPQLRYTPSGAPVAEVGLAVNRTFTDAQGQKREETCYVDLVLWRKQAETVQKYLRKGSPIFVEGRLNMESWDGQDGQKRTRMKVVVENFQFMDSQADRQARGGYDAAPPASEDAEGPADPAPQHAPASEIPF